MSDYPLGGPIRKPAPEPEEWEVVDPAQPYIQRSRRTDGFDAQGGLPAGCGLEHARGFVEGEGWHISRAPA